MPVKQEELEKKLTDNFDPLFLRVEDFSDGCGAKYNILIVSAKFEQLSLLARQRLVNEILKDEMNQIHALTQKCLTPEQWEKNKDQYLTTTANTQDSNTKCLK